MNEYIGDIITGHSVAPLNVFAFPNSGKQWETHEQGQPTAAHSLHEKIWFCLVFTMKHEVVNSCTTKIG